MSAIKIISLKIKNREFFIRNSSLLFQKSDLSGTRPCAFVASNYVIFN